MDVEWPRLFETSPASRPARHRTNGNRLPLVRCLAGRDAGEVSNNRGHSTSMLDDITGVGSGAVEVGFFSDGFPQSNDSEERIVQFMPDSGGESSETARF